MVLLDELGLQLLGLGFQRLLPLAGAFAGRCREGGSEVLEQLALPLVEHAGL